MIRINRNNHLKIYHFDMKDEFTSAMHEELTIDAETEIKHKLACVKKLLGANYTEEELNRYCALYNIPSSSCACYSLGDILFKGTIIERNLQTMIVAFVAAEGNLWVEAAITTDEGEVREGV